MWRSPVAATCTRHSVVHILIVSREAAEPFGAMRGLLFLRRRELERVESEVRLTIEQTYRPRRASPRRGLGLGVRSAAPTPSKGNWKVLLER